MYAGGRASQTASESFPLLEWNGRARISLNKVVDLKGSQLQKEERLQQMDSVAEGWV